MRGGGVTGIGEPRTWAVHLLGEALAFYIIPLPSISVEYIDTPLNKVPKNYSTIYCLKKLGF